MPNCVGVEVRRSCPAKPVRSALLAFPLSGIPCRRQSPPPCCCRSMPPSCIISVTDRRGHVVSTSVTTLDVHDIARAARTFGLRGYFIVTPLEPQHWLVNRIVAHWHGGWGTEYNPSRGDALNTVRLAADLAGVGDAISEETGHDPVWVGTSARRYPNSVSFADLKARLAAPDAPPHCLVFGTGWGLHPELVGRVRPWSSNPSRDRPSTTIFRCAAQPRSSSTDSPRAP